MLFLPELRSPNHTLHGRTENIECEGRLFGFVIEGDDGRGDPYLDQESDRSIPEAAEQYEEEPPEEPGAEF